jgi:hypothetical protein
MNFILPHVNVVVMRAASRHDLHVEPDMELPIAGILAIRYIDEFREKQGRLARWRKPILSESKFPQWKIMNVLSFKTERYHACMTEISRCSMMSVDVRNPHVGATML